MAHEVETMAYADALPWHGLGTKVSNDLTPEQMLEAAELNWEVQKLPLSFEFEGRHVSAYKKKALVRMSDGKLLDYVGDDWNPLQNQEAFSFFEDFVAEGDMEMHTAGSLMDGRRVWALAKVKNSFEVFKDDVVDNYLLFSNPHQYGMSIDIRMTPIRVVCNNTLTFALNHESSRMVKVNHRAEFDSTMVKEMLGVAEEKMASYAEAAKFLGSKRFTNEDIVEYFSRLFPTNSKKKDEEQKLSRNAQAAMSVIDTQPGAEYGAGTWWAGFNAVTYMTDHTLGNSADTRISSAWFGVNRKKKEQALKLALEYAEA